MRDVSRIAIAVAVAACAAVCGSNDQPPATNQPAPEPLADRQGPAEAEVESGYIGVLVPSESAEITASVTTDVVEYKVKLGDRVEIGDVIALLDEAPVREQLAIAKAELKASKAAVAQAAVARKAAAAALKREKIALRESVASKADVAEAEFRAREAGAGVSQAAAAVQQQQARIAALETRLADMTVKAPIAGKVSLRYVEPGSRVNEGEPVVRVISSDEVVVRFAIPSEDVGRVKPGDEVEVAIESKDQRATAVVKSVAPELDPVAQMIRAEADITDITGENLQSGLVCRIHPKAISAGNRTN
jgi:RND family efflux transporter MFP subunit